MSSRNFRGVFFAAVVFGIFTPVSQAGFLIDPYVGYAVSEGESTQVATGGTTQFENKSKSLTYGARLGWQFPIGLSIGADYSVQPVHKYYLSVKDGFINTFNGVPYAGYTFGASATHMGIHVGWKLPMFLRVWGTYFISSELELGDQSASPPIFAAGNTLDGDGIGAGIGLSIFPMIDINFEWRSFDFDPINPGAGYNYTLGLKYTEYLVAIGIPLDI